MCIRDRCIPVRYRFVLWCQGETAGDLGTVPSVYEKDFLRMLEALLSKGIEHLFLIRIGYYNTTATPGLPAPDYAPILQAQDHLADTCQQVTMVSRLFSGKMCIRDRQYSHCC